MKKFGRIIFKMKYNKSNDIRFLIRLARFRKEVRKLPPLKIPEQIKKAAEQKGYRFN